jgi:hypothetical protein
VFISIAVRQTPQPLIRQVFDAWSESNAEQMRDAEDQISIYVDKSSFSLLPTHSSEGFAASIS